MTSIDLSAAIALPPTEVSNYFQGRGYKQTWNWNEIQQETHTKAFTVAKCVKLDILQDIRSEVQKSIDNGLTFEEFQKNLEPTLKKKGWWGIQKVVNPNTGKEEDVQLGSPWRLKTIYDTNIQTAYRVGDYKEQIENVDHRPFWKYVAKLDSKTRQAHRALNGKIFAYDDPFWDSFYPPNGYRCRCAVDALTQYDIDRKNLQVEKSDGKLLTQEKIIPKSDETAFVTAYRTEDPSTGKFYNAAPDVGWNYNPGKINHQLDLIAAGKLKDCPEILQKQFLKEMVGSEWHKKVWSSFVSDVRKTPFQNKGLSTTVGYLDHPIYSKLKNYNKQSSPVIVADDFFVNHAMSSDKTKHLQIISQKQMKSLPEILNNPNAIIIDHKDPALLFITNDDNNPNNSIKIIVKMDKPVHKIKEKVTRLATVSTVQTSELHNKRYEIIYGKI